MAHNVILLFLNFKFLKCGDLNKSCCLTELTEIQTLTFPLCSWKPFYELKNFEFPLFQLKILDESTTLR